MKAGPWIYSKMLESGHKVSPRSSHGFLLGCGGPTMQLQATVRMAVACKPLFVTATSQLHSKPNCFVVAHCVCPITLQHPTHPLSHLASFNTSLHMSGAPLVHALHAWLFAPLLHPGHMQLQAARSPTAAEGRTLIVPVMLQIARSWTSSTPRHQ